MGSIPVGDSDFSLFYARDTIDIPSFGIAHLLFLLLFLLLSLCNFVLILNSGLDASSSLEMLNHLNLVAESGRLVILTIHQPRLEIFHLFHKILFLCDGQVTE